MYLSVIAQDLRLNAQHRGGRGKEEQGRQGGEGNLREEKGERKKVNKLVVRD